jgi:hypothetical protein
VRGGGWIREIERERERETGVDQGRYVIPYISFVLRRLRETTLCHVPAYINVEKDVSWRTIRVVPLAVAIATRVEFKRP